MCNWVMFIAFALMMSGCAASPPMFAPIAGDAEDGAQLFAQGRDEVPPCLTCHRVIRGQVGFSIGPNLAGIGERAGTQVAGLSAEEYVRQSILEPERYIVSGYRDIMYPDYSAHLTEQNIQDLIAYLLML
ncbi:MAG: c-type cytochrome [Anaerolineae bacterium]|nr:c-type cytochrome [Anaerolineae bacterium]